jgi:hypothetical protein
MMTTMTGETCTILKPRQIADLMVVAIEDRPKWLSRLEKLDGLNELTPFYVCPKFWASPFRVVVTTRDGVKEIGQPELGQGLTILATRSPGAIQRIFNDTYTVEDARQFARAVMLGDIHE